MHLHTIVKVRAASEQEAIERVYDLLNGDGEYHLPPPFDWVDDEETKISEDVKTEEDFLKLREAERDEHIENLRLADAVAANENLRGFYIRKAGECLEERNFWSTERIQYTLHWEDGPNVYYVETDRHF